MSKVMSAERAPGARSPRFRRSEPGQAPFPALVGARHGAPASGRGCSACGALLGKPPLTLAGLF
jgi:hypothetical protein